MPVTLLTKHENGGPTDVPVALGYGELAVNTQAAKIWVGASDGTPVELADGLTPVLEPGTAEGQALRWDNTAEEWVPTPVAILGEAGDLDLLSVVGATSAVTLGEVSGEPGVFQLRTSDTFSFATGNIGFGTTNPQFSISAIGTIGIQTSGGVPVSRGYVLSGGAGSASNTTYGFNGQSAGMYCPATNELAFSTTNSEALRINSFGQVLVNTPTSLFSGYAFQVSNTRALFNNAGTTAVAFANSGVVGGFIGGAAAGNALVFSSAAGSTRMTLRSDGNLGLGVTNPQDLLELGGAGAIDSGISFGLRNNPADFFIGTKQSGVLWGNGNYIQIKNVNAGVDIGDIHTRTNGGNITFGGQNDSEFMRIANGGNVGIGTANPVERLDIAAGAIRVINGVALTNEGDGAAYFYKSADGASVSSSVAVTIRVASTERARFTSAGFLGIGVTNPGAPVDLEAPATGAIGMFIRGRASDDVGIMRFTNNDRTSNSAQIASFSNGLRLETLQANPISFRPNSVEQMRLENDGILLLGLSSSIGAADGQLQISADSGRPGITISADGNDTTAEEFIKFRLSNGTGSGLIKADGATSAAFAAFSDASLKTDVTDYVGALDELNKLRPVQFTWIQGGESGVGFIAQEVEEVYPEAVSVDKETGKKMLTGMSRLDARIIAAIKEQQQIIDGLCQRIAQLESA